METALIVTVLLNGDRREIPVGTTLSGLVEILHLPADRLAIEHDRSIVKRGLWAETVIDEGSEIEIVQFVGGG